MARWGLAGRCPTSRDVISDMIDACKARGLRVYLYTHPYQPVASDWNDFINQIYAEVVDRYGSRIDGLWLDENMTDATQDRVVDYRRLMKTIHQRNPDLVTMQNNGAVQIYTCDMGVPENWGGGGYSTPLFKGLDSPENMLRLVVAQAAANFEGGGVHWNIDGVGLGGLSTTAQIFALGHYLAPVMQSLTNTQPSTSFPPVFNGRVVSPSQPWLATRSLDDRKEFIHVLTAPGGNTLTLPAPVDGKIFTNATLLASLQTGAATQQVLNADVTLLQTPRGIQLTLTGTNTWSALDTVIQLDVGSPGGAGVVNDTSPNVSYTAGSWSYQSHRGLGEYADDVHTATANGDAFTLTFSGTEVSLIASRGPDRGGVDLYLDDVLQMNVDLSLGTTNREVVFTGSGLPRGTHTLKGVKTSGTSLVVDAFRVVELINDNAADDLATFMQTTSYDHSAAGYGPAGNQWQWSGGWVTPQMGDYFVFSFYGTSAQCLLSSGYGSGTFTMYLDGVSNAVVAVGGPTTFTLTNLPNTSHTIQGVVSADPGGFIASVVGFNTTSYPYRSDLTANSASYGPATNQWSSLPGTNGVQVTSQVGDYFNLSFYGSGLQCHLDSAAGSGTVTFYVDGVSNATVAVAGPATFTCANLSNGTHTLQGVVSAADPGGFTAQLNGFRVALPAPNYSAPNQWQYSTSRNLGEFGDDVHLSDVQSSGVSYTFTGSGVDLICTRDSTSGTTYYSLNGSGQSMSAPRNNYLGSLQSGASVFGLPNLTPGTYSVSAQNAANSSGLNFSYVRLNIDALRVYKGELLSGTPLLWGASGAGGSGTWDVATTANWYDGGTSTKWYDFGGTDYAALFQGTAGTVSLSSGIKANRLTFSTTGYTLQNNTLTLNGNSPTITTASNVMTTVNSVIAGSAGLVKAGPGTLTLSGINTYTGGTTVSAGTLKLHSTYAASSFSIAANSVLELTNASTLDLASATFAGSGTLRKTGVGQVQWGGGAATFALGPGSLMDIQGGTFVGGSSANEVWSNNLSDLNVASGATFSTVEANVRVNRITGTGAIGTGYTGAGYQNLSLGVDHGSSTFDGVIQNTENNPSYVGNVVKTGTGTITLNGINTYTGTTTVSNGMLRVNGSLGAGTVTVVAGATVGGAGTIKGPVSVQPGAALAPGASIGTLTISNTLTLQAGSQTFMELNPAAGTNDQVRGITTVNYGGTLVLTNLAGTVSAGQTFKLFSAANRTGNFSAITPTNPAPGLEWNFNPTNGVLTAAATVALNPTNVTASVSGTNLTLSWPSGHTGWTLLQQTNNLNLGVSANTNDWMRLPGSSATNSVVIPLLPNTPGGYYRLVYP